MYKRPRLRDCRSTSNDFVFFYFFLALSHPSYPTGHDSDDEDLVIKQVLTEPAAVNLPNNGRLSIQQIIAMAEAIRNSGSKSPAPGDMSGAMQHSVDAAAVRRIGVFARMDRYNYSWGS